MNISDYIKKECITFDLKATTKLSAIKELSSLLHSATLISDQDIYVESVLLREEEYTTGIGAGIAIPHGKSSCVHEACIAYGKSTQGIEWQALDEQLVFGIFLLAIPESGDQDHLEMLSQLARKLMHKEVKDAVLAANDHTAFYKAIE